LKDYPVDFLGVGGLSYDLVLRVERLPSSDDKIPGTLMGRLPGGYIANATCAAARLGLDTGYVGWVGNDTEGAMLDHEFRNYRVNTAGLISVSGEPTPFTVIMVNGEGERSIIIPAFNLYDQPLSDEQLEFARRAKIVLSFARDEAWCRRLAEAAHDGEGSFALDIESSSPLKGEALRSVIDLADVVFVTEDSLPLLGVEAIEQLAGPRWVILTAGKRGAYGIIGENSTPIYQPALAVNAVDTTGAGDCFHAALLAARHRGADLPEALAFATAAAAIKVQHDGARGGLPTRAEVDMLVRSALHTKGDS
jgi:sugar/nucleoside kinase (ribokinase family)